MKIIVFGGDGFCGWPLALNLSARDHDCIIVDNYNRRNIDKELNSNSITPISSLKKRVEFWNKNTNYKKLSYQNFDICNDIKNLQKIIISEKPDAVIMLAEFKSAPYSLMNLKNGNRTINNNLIANHNILNLLAKYSPNTQYVHLGTMGVYGYDYSNKLIPDGYYKATLKNHLGDKIETKILHPASPGSIYHLTKAQEELMFQYFSRLYGLSITDLHQGIVWGVNTKLTVKNEILFNRFDYDGIYETALNRFIAQAAINHKLTVHGSGNQIRPFINIEDSVNSMTIALENPNKSKEVRVFNQLTETFKVKDIANLVSNMSNVKINNQTNPRIENENNSLKAKPIGLKKLGLQGFKLNKNNISDLIELAKKYKSRIKDNVVISKVKWKLT